MTEERKREADVPSVETLATIARDMGWDLSEDRLRQAAESHAAFRPHLDAFRRLKFPYLDPIEPGHAQKWIENGGRSTWTPRSRPDPS